ncbi:uncharacterized protein [Anoplolepis gracilipes]|uniref:uncharacterized protein n=1 Tax=Anoplolepis gracilipes TaxID=354296 RepID=UPI003BA14438
MASERWKDDIAYAMTPYKLFTWPIGVWPLQVYNIYLLLRCVLAIGSACLVVILPSMELYMGCTNVEKNINCLMMICCGLLGGLKTIWFRIYANSLIDNYDSAINDYMKIENTKERDIMRKHAFIGRHVCCPLLGFSYFCCLVYGMTSVLTYNQGNRINMSNEDAIFEYAIPSRCALEYLNFPRSMFKISCLVETIVIMLVSTTNLGFQLILALKINDTVMAGKSFVVLSSFVLQLTLYSFIGNYLKSEMEDIGLSIYQSTWYNFPRKMARNVIFILMQTKFPVTLQAGNFIVVNLSTFVSILRTSFSYLSVLRVMMGV